MLDHLAVQVADVDAAAAFYLRVFEPIGMRELMRYPTPGGPVVGLGGADGKPSFWLGPLGPGALGSEGAAREAHIAFVAPDRNAVDKVHEVAVAAGVEVLHPPRVWPEYHAGYYGVFLRDPDGNNVEAVHHGL